MKLSALVFAAATVDARRYSFKELMLMFKDGENPIPAWGSKADTDGQRAFENWKFCEPIPVPEGADEVRCSGESCAVECKGGYYVTGNPQTKCKKDPKNPGQFVWRRPLGSCYSCAEDPSFKDWRVFSNCSVTKGNKRKCDFGCLQDGKLEGAKWAQCKCKRSKGASSCAWYSKGNKQVKSFNQKCVGGGKVDYVEVECGKKPGQCFDVTEDTSLMNAWTCRNCIRIRSEWKLPETFDNRDHMVMTFSEDIQPINWAHPMSEATNPSGDMRTWYIKFSKEALFGDRRMDFTSEWRNMGKRSNIVSARGCSCKNKIPKE